MKQVLITLCIIGSSFQLTAQNDKSHAPIIFIYDASGSMWGQMEGKTKMEVATTVLSNSVNQLSADQKIGLVAYGHRTKGDCKDVEFLVGMDNVNKSHITQSLKSIKPLGKTPLAYSAIQVIEKLRLTGAKATIILVTDGIESCGGNICKVIKEAKTEGIDFRLHIIGFGLKSDESDQLQCAANAGGGQYYDAADAGALGDVLNEATSATVDDAVGNFTVSAIKNGKPIDALVQAFEAGSKTSIKSARTYGDTASLYLPPGKYDLKITPLEGSDVDAIRLSNVQSFEKKVIHKTVSFDGGKINVTVSNNQEGWDAVIRIYDRQSGKSAATGRTYGKSGKYELNPGVYDVDIRPLTIEGIDIKQRIENVEVRANQVENVAYDFKTGIAMIGAKSVSALVDAVIKIKDVNTNKSAASGRTYTSPSSNPNKFILIPGTYEVTLTALGDHKGKKETFTIVVQKGATVEKIIKF